ncbi:hypothetical protein [Mastigocoleus testarum]|uniref:hypothetical protein n=1 Tax=Mastigocoleus testarum TaxID=996925 RepID=UPI00137B180A|nr:hypothetical protein [Mastigocoleus testarum]
MREGSVGGVGGVGGNPKEYKGVLKIGFGITSPRGSGEQNSKLLTLPKLPTLTISLIFPRVVITIAVTMYSCDR